MFAAIDLKSFYASVECVDRGLDPLTTNLVVADPTRSEKTICLAVSPSLKAYGISGRARLFEVVAKAKEIKKNTGKDIEYITAPPRMSRYMEVSTEIYQIYLKYVSADDIHVYSIDEVFIALDDYMKLYKMSAHELTMKMVKDVYKTTGITATAGIGTNLYLSKIAMDIVAKKAKPDSDGVRMAELDEISYRKLLWDHTPLTDFWRIGRGIERRLNRIGLKTMGDVARTSINNEDVLYRIFGIDAELLIDHAWGYEPCKMSDIKNYKAESNSVSSGQVLSCPYDFDSGRLIVKEMTELMCLDLVRKNVSTDNIALYVGYDRISVDEGTYFGEVKTDHYGRKVPKPAGASLSLGTFTNSTKKIMAAMLDLYDRIVDRNLYVRRVTITANHLTEECFEQFDLFTDPKAMEKEKKLQHAMIDIQDRYGKNAILKGMNLEKGGTTIERNSQIGGHKA